VFIACQQDRERVPDVSHIDVDFKSVRFDQALQILREDSVRVADSLAMLYRQFPVFASLILEDISKLRDPKMSGQDYASNIYAYLNDNGIKYLTDDLNTTYGNIEDLKKDFKKSYQLATHYFPDKQIPDIYYYFSEYGIAHFIFQDKNGNDALGVGLDFYLGSDYPYASIIPNHTTFSNYLTRTFNRAHIVPKTLATWIEDWKPRSDGSRLLDHMIYEGQKLYVLDKLTPHVADTTIFQFTPEELQWVYDNELQIWSHFIDENVLFDEQPHTIQRYVAPAPFTRGMPKESPGRTGVFIGYRIVERFMQKNPDVTLSDLINMTNPQLIYDQSRYRPR